MESTPIVNTIKTWLNMLEHIRNLNIRGYQDIYQEDLNISMGFGQCDRDFVYILISVTDNMEICMTAHKTVETLKDCIEEESGWDVESVWKNDKKVVVNRVTSLEIKEE